MQINFTPEQIKEIWDKENRKAWQSEQARLIREQEKEEMRTLKAKYMRKAILTYNMRFK